MSTQRARWIDFDEYLRIEARGERKHEYDDGGLTAMAGATAGHVTIVQNIVAALRGHLRGSSCRVYSTDMKLRPIHGSGYYPDAFVTCDERDRSEELVKRYPRLVVEVLSEGTERRDRGIKWAVYRGCETLEQYVLVARERQSVEVFSRSGEAWLYQAYGAGEAVRLSSVDLTMTMDVIYEDIAWVPRALVP